MDVLCGQEATKSADLYRGSYERQTHHYEGHSTSDLGVSYCTQEETQVRRVTLLSFSKIEQHAAINTASVKELKETDVEVRKEIESTV